MSCNCDEKNDKIRFIYSCSGAANTGYLADRVWRELKEFGAGSGLCLAAIGANIPSYMKSAKEAGENIVIDGCPVGCGKKIFEDKNLSFTSYFLTDFGVEKGKTEITEDIVDRVSDRIREKIGESNG